jgi:putative membrane protein
VVGAMNTTADLLLHGWEVHPTVVAGCLALIAWHFAAAPRLVRYAAPFLLGVLILCLALISPIDPLGDAYLFSAHMLQHLLLILIVPPLLILGLAPQRAAAWMSHPRTRQAESVLGRPVVAWSSNMLMMVIWHLPALYNAANANTAIHIVEHLTFLVTGCMFWWPIVTPLQGERMQPGPAMLYLFGAAVVSTLLGIVITFLPAGLYHPYLHPVDELGALHLIRDTWGISAAEDQKLAGLIMWVPGCSIYFAAMLVELGAWFRIPGADKRALLASLNSQAEVRHG